MGQRDRLDSFWLKFSENYWEKAAVLIEPEQAASLPKIGDSELFTAVVACVSDFCRGGRQKVRLYVDSAGVDVLGGGHEALLPRHDDRSFERYNERMVEREGLSDYALVIADWHQFDRTLWERVLASTHGLAATVGISHSRMDTQVFLGTYKATPFGVHCEPTSGFHFPVVGSKRMRFWPDDFAASNPELHNSLDYERFLSASTVRVARPGQVLYWPSSDWHVGESDGQFSVTWGFGYWLGDGMPNLALQELARMLVAMPSVCRVFSPAELLAEAQSGSSVDALIGKIAACVAGLPFHRAMTKGWLEHFSACGYLRVPPMEAGLGHDRKGSVAKKPMHTILLSPEGPASVRIAAGGYSEVFRDDPGLRAAVDALIDGRPIALRTLGDAPCETPTRRLLDFCARAGILTTHPP